MRSVRSILPLLAILVLGLPALAWGQAGPVPGIPFIYSAREFQAADGNVTLRILGSFPPDTAGFCWYAEPQSNSPPILRMAQSACPDSGVTPGGTWSWIVDLGRLAPGHHQVLLTVLQQRTPFGTGAISYQGYFSFDILPDSSSGLPYVSEVLISPADSLGNRPICPSDSIRVTLGGMFPNACYSLKRIDIAYHIMTPVPGPPVIVLTVDRGGCLDCRVENLPWRASVVLPPQPAGQYAQPLQMIEVDCALPDSVLASHIGFERFEVRGDCGGPTLQCLWPGFEHPNGFGACDAFISPEGTARVTFNLRTGVALAGLQGRFFVDPAKLRIVRVQPVGPALGMHLNWAATENGARFTMFAESGAPIPGCGGSVFDEIGCQSLPIIDVTLASLDPQVPGDTWVNVGELLGSDVFGNGVRMCPVRSDSLRLAVMGARVCAELGCDFNADGRTDVRDLVLMVHCVNDSTKCTQPTFDCNRDSTRSIEDVICCAIHILRDGRTCPPDCPPDTTRPAPHVRATMGEPVSSETGVEVPLTLIGAEALGGAVLEFDFPSARYDVDVSLSAGGSPAWLELDELRDGRLAVGLVRTSPIMTLDVDQRLDLTLRFTLKPGQTPGGDLSYSGGEFSGWDGALLEVDLGSLGAPLGGEAQMSLSEPRPNPSAGETRFSLTLDRATDIELGVYDLNGRRVATIHQGPLSAGPHEFQWQGRTDRGGTAANGIYFYRAIGGGASATRKLVLLRGR